MNKETAYQLLNDFKEWLAKDTEDKIDLYSEIGFHAFDGICIRYFSLGGVELMPIEVKANTDRFDERLPRQIATQLYWFGSANVVLGSKIGKKSDEIIKWLSANVYRKTKEGFEQIKYQDKTEGAMMSVRATNGYSSEIDFLHEMYRKCLFNRIAYGKEIKFTNAEKYLLQKTREVQHLPDNDVGNITKAERKQKTLGEREI